MSSIANRLLRKLSAGGKPIKESADQCLLDVLDHLKWLQSRHAPKAYSDEYVISTAYGKPRALRKDSEIAAYCRVHLQLATRQFGILIDEIKGANGKVPIASLRRYSEIVRDYLFDLLPIAEFLERRKDDRYEFFRGGKSYGVASWEIFRVSRQLAIQSAFRGKPFHIDHKTSQIACVFVFRQALEAKFNRIVAVYFLDKNGQTPKIKHDFHYNFIVSNIGCFEFTSVNFPLLGKIYDWCNSIVHQAYQPLAWQIPHAQSVCSGLWAHGPLTKKGGSSVHGGIRILDLEDMQGRFAEHFAKSYDHGTWCIGFEKPEAVISYYT
jgi:hypothetical protein